MNRDKELHRITATAVIHKDGKFLITKRSPHKKVFPGKWTVPGGGLSIDDYIHTPPTYGDIWYSALENALRREIREEVGLEVGKLEYLLDLTFIRPDNIPVITLSFHAPYKSGEIVLDEDSTEFAWINADEARNYDLIEGIPEELKMVEAILEKQ
jgi:8-oxo-dGTP pyrophosphatase MutT (NUDIX family)